MTTDFEVHFWGKIMFTRNIFVSETLDLFDVF